MSYKISTKYNIVFVTLGKTFSLLFPHLEVNTIEMYHVIVLSILVLLVNIIGLRLN